MARPRLTLDDVVDQTTLGRFVELDDLSNQLGRQLLRIEEEKLRLLVESRGISQERTALIERVAMDRGLPPNTPIVVHMSSGQVYLKGQEPPVDSEPVVGDNAQGTPTG